MVRAHTVNPGIFSATKHKGMRYAVSVGWRVLQRWRWTAWVVPCSAVSVALVCGAFLVWASGASVTAAYGGLLAGMCGSWSAVGETWVTATPYLLTGLAVALGLHGGLFNIGAEGQLYLGALGAAVVGYALPDLPAWLHLPCALLAGMSAGALWGAIPGLLKAACGVHEVLNTIMMNYVAVKGVDYLVKQVLRDPAASLDQTPAIRATAHLPLLFGAHTRLHLGCVLALGCAVLVWGLLRSTTIGFGIHAVGANPRAARYAGFRVPGMIVLVMALAGALAGLAGAGEVLGLYHTLPATFSSGYGFDAIAVAFLAKAHPLGVVLAALLWGGLRNGASVMQLRSGVSSDMMLLIQALVMLGVAADPLLRRLWRACTTRRRVLEHDL